MYDINIQYVPFKDIVNCLVSVGHNVVIIFHPKAQKFAPSFLPSNESTFQHFRYASPEIMRTQVRWTTTKVGGLTTTGALRCNMRGQLVQKHQHIADLFIATLHQFSIGFNLTALVR